MPGYPERRKLSRLPLTVLLQVLVTETSEVFFGETCNVNARGIFFHTNRHLKVGQNVECVLLLPEYLTLATKPISVGCTGAVMRVHEAPPGARMGVAIEITSFDFSDNHVFTDRILEDHPAATPE